MVLCRNDDESLRQPLAAPDWFRLSELSQYFLGTGSHGEPVSDCSAEITTSYRASGWQRRIGSGSPSFRAISWNGIARRASLGDMGGTGSKGMHGQGEVGGKGMGGMGEMGGTGSKGMDGRDSKGGQRAPVVEPAPEDHIIMEPVPEDF